MSDSGIVEQLRGNKRFSVLFAEEKAKRTDAEFCSILEKVEDLLRNKGPAFDLAAKVQETTIPQIFDGYDVMARAQTGAGKTLAFAIGMVAKVNRSNSNIQAICFSPTQELVTQTKNVIASLVQDMTPEIRVVDTSITSNEIWKSMTKDTLPHIVVSTAGGLSSKLKNLTGDIKKKWARDLKRSILGNVKLLVLDEADDMIMDSNNGITKTELPFLREYGLNFEQVVCYSATYNSESERQIKAICRRTDGRKLQILELPYAISPAIKQIVIKIKSEKDKNVTLQRKMEALKDIYRNNVVQKSIIFMNKKHDDEKPVPGDASIDSISAEIENLSNRAAGLDYVCRHFYKGMKDPLNPSDNSADQNEYRRKVFANFCKPKGQEGAFDVVVTSDVMARGIDLPEINLVVNFDLPMTRDRHAVEPITYIHRIGRCSRFGKIGAAVTFIEEGSTGFDDIKEYCTNHLIPGKSCAFNYDEIIGEEKIGERVSTLITEFKSRGAAVIEQEAKLEFVVREDDGSAATAADASATVFDSTVDAIAGDLSKATIGGAAV